MKNLVSALIFTLACCGIGLAQTGKNATAQEKKQLFQLILKDKGVSERLADIEGGASKLAESLRVEKKDLNQDGQPEHPQRATSAELSSFLFLQNKVRK